MTWSMEQHSVTLAWKIINLSLFMAAKSISAVVVTVLKWIASVIPIRAGEIARAKAAEDDDIVLFGVGTSIGGLGRGEVIHSAVKSLARKPERFRV